MKYNRADINSTLRAAKYTAQQWQRTVYVYAVLCGFTVTYDKPPLSQSYYEILPTGEIKLIEYGNHRNELWSF